MLKVIKLWVLAACVTGTLAFIFLSGRLQGYTASASTDESLLARGGVSLSDPQTYCNSDSKEASFALPSDFLPNNLPKFQDWLTCFLQSKQYLTLHWCADKSIRDTGPYIGHHAYGIHPAVKIYYSPKVMTWLINGRQGVIPDGAMIVKEQYQPPSARYLLNSPPPVSDWTIMIKDSKGSKDGWYWAEIWNGQTIDSNAAPFAIPNSGFGLYCTRCHTSAEKEFTFSSLKNITGFPGEPLTFFVDLSWVPSPTPTPSPTPVPSPTPTPTPCPPPIPGQTVARQLLKRTQTPKKEEEVHVEIHAPGIEEDIPPLVEARRQMRAAPLTVAPLATHDATATPTPTPTPSPTPNPAFVKFYNSIQPPPFVDVKKIPSETYDHVVAAHDKPQHFLTSDSCMSCHSASYYGGVMIYTGATQPDGTVPGMNVSPYGEWRWSPMGLSGRDPIFYSQLDSEIAYLQTQPDSKAKIQQVINTCFSCHGVMGKRQNDLDHGGSADFKREYVDSTYDNVPDPKKDETHIYGALARDGVSCSACHHIVEKDTPGGVSISSFLENNITGNFDLGPADTVHGPFKDNEIVTEPMNNALGVKPKFDSYIKNSRMCGSCHTINLPVVDDPHPEENDCKLKGFFSNVGHGMEQATYLEWLNSAYQDEFKHSENKAKAQSCQACHMPTSYTNSTGTLAVPLIQNLIANIESDQYPATENRANADQIMVRFRQKDFVRHQLQGLNTTLLELFYQNPSSLYSAQAARTIQADDILGVRQNDYMLGYVNMDLPNAIDAFTEQAKSSTATVTLQKVSVNKQTVVADVTLTNKTGHRFPSGVGFRRAFIEFKVTDNNTGKPVWCSGCTNELGVILDGPNPNSNQPLPTELFSNTCHDSTGKLTQCYQPHFWGPNAPITDEKQVEIYEELDKNADGKFTTSFIRRDVTVKDNRLLPLGWTAKGPDPSIPECFLETTFPIGVGGDPRYADGKGTSQVRYSVTLPSGVNPNNVTITATLYYQSIPPYFLNDRFTQAPTAAATKRLYYLTSTLNAQREGSSIPNWKMNLVAAPPLNTSQK